MKRRYRERALNELYTRLGSDDFDVREQALFQLALLLRRSNAGKSEHDQPWLDDDSLPRDLQRIRFGQADQTQIVEALKRLIAERRESRASAFWTLAEVDAELAWEAMSTSLAAFGEQLDDEAAYQACRALRSWLETGQFAASHENVAGSTAVITKLLEKWAGSPRRRLAAQASATLEVWRRLA